MSRLREVPGARDLRAGPAAARELRRPGLALTWESLPLTAGAGATYRDRVPAGPGKDSPSAPTELRKGGGASEADGQAHVPMGAGVNSAPGPWTGTPAFCPCRRRFGGSPGRGR